MKNIINKINSRIPAIIWVLLIYTAIMLFFGHYKIYLYEDEVLSYTAANYHSPNKGVRFDLSDRTMYDASDIMDAITVSEGERFDYSNVVKNTSYDPHPPLFLFLLHTFSSLFPGVFSVWYGLAINIIFGLMTLFTLYLLAKEISGSKVFSVFVSLVFACLEAFVNISDYLRMYVMLGFFTLLLLLQYVKLLKKPADEKKPDLKAFAFLILTTVLGTLTQYYFLVFAFYAAFFYEIVCLKRKQFKTALIHALSYLISGGLVLLLFPSIIWQMTQSHSATASFELGSPTELISRVYQMFVLLNLELFNGRVKWIILALIAFCIWRFVFHKEKNPLLRDIPLLPYLSVIWVAMMYYITVSATTPHLTVRYLSPVYAPVILIVLILLRPVVDSIFAAKPVGYFALLLVFSIGLISEIKGGLYDVNKEIMQRISLEYSNDYCILFTVSNPEENFFELMNYKGFYRIHMSENEPIDERISSADELVIYVPEKRTLEECVEYMQQFNPELKYTRHLYKAYYSDAYLLSINEDINEN
ncbi:hypothetical protein QYZ88_010130 [Lachnospiraceae bacterium C1.1]|nr:hypothetical protein [Lachnospiraceae bacterium C1.1]